ncbi:pyridoxamine 5'-phosphate oxidase [Sulfitobacter sp. SK011]|nr:pyridoxamine 5'-phosphate oxidase [Sulfitobacter sp. SK011]
MNVQPTIATTQFHAGEREMQKRAGKSEAIEAIGKIAIRPFMPDQHRAFYEQIPFILVGSLDRYGWPWASMLVGGANFIKSPDNKRLDLDATPLADDPLAANLKQGAPVGLVGIELSTRRRNRMNATVRAVRDGGISLEVVQSFGNCPQYIQTHDVSFLRSPKAQIDRTPTQRFTQFDAAAQSFIAQANSFYVASSSGTGENPTTRGADVSHRGGQAGFVKVEGNSIIVPDFSGNNFFNTLGNFLVSPKAGLLFPDYTTGDILMLTGTTEVFEADAPEIACFKGAERGWRFTLDHGIRIHDALPFRAEFTEWSPNSLMADNWTQAEARQKLEAERAAWRPLKVTAIKDESSVIRSFTFDAVDDQPLLSFEAGQFLTIRVTPEGAEPQTRTYTVSSAPGDQGYRISVKREPGGAVSNHLHDTLKVGDVIDAKAPKGGFFIDALEKRPAVLFAGGVGVTPMMSMTRHVLNESVRKRYTRPLTVFHAAQTTDQRAFLEEFRAAETQSDGRIKYVSIVGHPEDGEVQGTDYDATGYITPDLIRSELSFNDFDFFLCGPPSFMQAVYDALRDLGARDVRIFAEAFGPAALKRHADVGATAFEPEPEAETAVVKFAQSGHEQHWKKDDATLLETAEAHGVTPPFSCRSGSCGSCITKKLSGNVVYRTPVTAEHGEDDVLICSAVPAKDTEELVLDL